MKMSVEDDRLLEELCDQHGVSKESFASINSKLGVVQKGALTEAIRASYAKRAGSSAPYPDFPDILEVATAAYEEDGKKDDSLIEVLRDLSDFELFWRHGSEGAPMDRVSNRTMLIDVHAMPVLKELVAYLWSGCPPASSTPTMVCCIWPPSPTTACACWGSWA